MDQANTTSADGNTGGRNKWLNENAKRGTYHPVRVVWEASDYGRTERPSGVHPCTSEVHRPPGEQTQIEGQCGSTSVPQN